MLHLDYAVTSGETAADPGTFLVTAGSIRVEVVYRRTRGDLLIYE